MDWVVALLIFVLGYGAGWVICEHFHILGARRGKPADATVFARTGAVDYRVVEQAGVHYVERFYGRKSTGAGWYRLAPTHAQRWAPPAWWSHYPPQSFASFHDAHAAMIAEKGRDLADVPIVKAEL